MSTTPKIHRTTHTPGPWVTELTPNSKVGDFWEIAPLGPDGEPDWIREVAATADSNRANAHLIAAAPDLYAALKSVVAWWEALAQEQYERTVLHQTIESASENWLKPSNVSPFSLDELKAALAKAEGKP